MKRQGYGKMAYGREGLYKEVNNNENQDNNLRASFLGLASLINYGCGFHIGAGIGKADGEMRDQGHIVQSPIKKDTSKLSQRETPPQG